MVGPSPVEFVGEVERCVSMREGEALKNLLSMTSDKCRLAGMNYLLQGGSLEMKTLDSDWAELPEMLQARFAAGSALTANNFAESVSYLCKVISLFLNIVGKEDAWVLPLLKSYCSDVRVLGEQADEQLRADGLKASKMEEVERILKRAFSVTNNDRRDASDGSRRVGTLSVINQLLKVYFKLNNLRLCNNIVRAVDAPNFPDFESTFPIADRVTYKYFVGRLHLYDDRIPQAVECLKYSFQRTPDAMEFRTQKRMQLLYLVPAKIHSGEIPKQELLRRYDMKCYMDLVCALRNGDLALFNRAMLENQEFFIKSALYLVLENVRPLVIRAMIRTIHHVAGTNKLKLQAVRDAMAACGVVQSREEVECVLANLIYNNFIRGYIAHKLGYLVLSVKNPFPALN